MKKIVFTLPNMPGGGTERVVALLANKYVEMGYSVTILLFAGAQCAYSLDERVQVCVVGGVSKGNPFVQIKRILNMRKFYKRNEHCHVFAFSVMGAVFTKIAAFGLSYKLLVSERNDPDKYEHPQIRNWAYAGAEKIILQTEEVKKCFPFYLQKKMIVIPNPIGDDMLPRYEGVRRECVVSVARLQPQKNHKLLIDSFYDFQKVNEAYKLLIFGVGPLEKELALQAEKLDIGEKVIFKGFSSDIEKQIWDSKMFVLSSDYEGISNAMIEAMAIGVPVISTDCPVGGSRMYITNDENGLLVPVGDRKALTEAMLRIVQNHDLEEKISINGTKIKEKYNVQKIAEMFLYEAGLENK